MEELSYNFNIGNWGNLYNLSNLESSRRIYLHLGLGNTGTHNFFIRTGLLFSGYLYLAETKKNEMIRKCLVHLDLSNILFSSPKHKMQIYFNFWNSRFFVLVLRIVHDNKMIHLQKLMLSILEIQNQNHNFVTFKSLDFTPILLTNRHLTFKSNIYLSIASPISPHLISVLDEMLAAKNSKKEKWQIQSIKRGIKRKVVYTTEYYTCFGDGMT